MVIDMAKSTGKAVAATAAGYEGAKRATADVREPGRRKAKRTIRARPGTFEWVFGRRTSDIALFHAGSHFAQLWEKAGTADAKSPDYEGVGGSSWKGLPDKRCDAISELNRASKKLGDGPTQRLTHYCIYGKTAAEIAAMYGVGDREMALVLKQDLRDCAICFRFLSVHGVDKQ